MTTQNTINYLCLYVEGDLQDVYPNFKQANESYIETFEDICQAENPEKITMSFMDVRYKDIVDMISFNGKDSLDKISFKIYDEETLIELHPEFC